MAKQMRRDVLKRLVQAGEIVFVGGYSFDDQYGESRPDHMKEPCSVVYKAPDDRSFTPDGTVCLRDHSFDSSVGRASVDERGVIRLYVHSNSSFDLMKKADWAKWKAEQPVVPAPEKPATPPKDPQVVLEVLRREIATLARSYDEGERWVGNILLTHLGNAKGDEGLERLRGMSQRFRAAVYAFDKFWVDEVGE